MTEKMNIEDAYRGAIVMGGNAVSFAMGLVDAALRVNPEDRRALMYKGGLLTIIVSDAIDAQKRIKYQRTGLSLMRRALNSQHASHQSETELQYVYATTLSMLPAGFEMDETAYAALGKLTERPNFHRLQKLEFVRSMTFLACLAEQFGQLADAKAHFVAARQADQDIAIETYSAWLNRG